MTIRRLAGVIAASRIPHSTLVTAVPHPGTASYLNQSDNLVLGGYGLGYNAFPGVVKLTGSTLLGVARQSTDHSVNGNIIKFTSTDNGASWSAPTTIRDNAMDIRDVELMKLASGDLLLSFTERTNSSVATDFVPYVMKSTDSGATWGTPVVITNGFSGWSFITSKIIELTPGGNLLAAMYGNDGSGDYCRVSRSTDHGATWSALSTIVAAGTSGRQWDEPVLTVNGAGDVLCGLRSDDTTAGIYISRSTDNGATWGAPVRQFDGSGRPALFYTQDAALVISYRHTDPNTGITAARWSFNDATSWSSAYLLNSTGVQDYGSWVNLGSGLIGLLWSTEQSPTRADLLFDTFLYQPA